MIQVKVFICKEQEALVGDEEVRQRKGGNNKVYVTKLPIIVGNWSVVATRNLGKSCNIHLKVIQERLC